MAFDTRRTYLCYNNRDLIRDGYIPVSIQKEYIPPSTFNINRAKTPPKGISYKIVKEEGIVVQVIETKKLLPASKIKIEIDFSKVMKNAVEHPISPGSIGFSPIANMIATPILAPIGMGGITEGLTEITYHLLDASTKINQRITLTKQMVEDGIIIMDDYPLSVFGVVKEINKEIENNGMSSLQKIGLDFTTEQLEILGKFSDGVWKESRRKRIDGATDSNGLYGGKGDIEIKFEDVAKEEQKQLFIKIIKDDRKLKFRADNEDATGERQGYPYKISGHTSVDVTDKQIKIDTSNLKPGDNIYITYSAASERRVRQSLTHLGRIAQGNTIGISGFVVAIKSESNIFDYQLCSWAVPELPAGITMKNIDEINNIYTTDNQYKLSHEQYIRIKRAERDAPQYNREPYSDTIEGWRVSEAITKEVKRFWTADYRGILLYDQGNIQVIFPRKNIRDQSWFTGYLEELEFTYPSGPDGKYIEADLVKNIENEIQWSEETGQLFDLSEITNSLLFDREKIPYHRPFAKALQSVSKYYKNDPYTGIGIINLDLYNKLEPYFQDLDLFDLSFIEFRKTNAQPNQIYSCEEQFDITPSHYFSYNYDAANEGPGAWYDRGYIENEVFEWRPSGGDIESYWKQETPYFCGSFTRNSRVYIEYMGGNSLDNYSWIYVDSQPFVAHNISVDRDEYNDDATVVFKDDEFHNGLAYHNFKDIVLMDRKDNYDLNIEQSHVKESYNYNLYKTRGYNRILGDSPSYSRGIPLTDEIRRICEENKENNFWEWKEIYREGKSDYGLNFSSTDPNYIPTVSIPLDWYIKRMIIEYDWDISKIQNESEIVLDKNRCISFYFPDTDVSIDNIVSPSLPFSLGEKRSPLLGGENKINIDFGYYYGNTIQFLGPLFNKIQIKRIVIRVTSVNMTSNIEQLDLANYKINSGQSAVVNDGLGRLIIFYSNTETGNIDAAITYDNGREWSVHKGIIRLVAGETATLPFTIKSSDREQVYLFYILNDMFLMCKQINTYDFEYQDANIVPLVPDSYQVGDYDSSLEDPESEYWGNFSPLGHNIRRSPSYFIAGDGESEYYQEQIKINEELNVSNQQISVFSKKQTLRFILGNKIENMKEKFNNFSYTCFIDNEGTTRVFIVSDNKLSIKKSGDFVLWQYDVENIEIHKDWVNDEMNEGKVIEIQNIQIVRNDYDNDVVSLLYFHNNMLFIRHFNAILLYPVYDEEGNMQNSSMKEHLELTSFSTNKPIFLAGNIPDDIKQKKIEEIEKGIFGQNSELLIEIPYTKEQIEKFNDNFSVDMETQPFGYVSAHGYSRILYKDNFGSLSSIIMDSFNKAIPEVWYKEKVNS